MRKHYLDNIRWVTQILVVIYHVIYMYNSVGVQGGLGKISNLDVQYYDVFMYMVYPWFMPVLFIVAGISSRFYLNNHTEKEFLSTRTNKLLVPSTIGLFVFWFILGYLNMSMGDAFANMESVPAIVVYFIMALSGTGPLWFLQILWVFSLFLIPIRKIDKDRLWQLGARTNVIALFVMTALVWGAAQILNMPIVVVYRFGFYFTFFIIGYFVFSHEEVVERVKRAFPIIAVAAVALGAAFCIMYFGQNFADAPINRSILFCAYAWIGSLAMISGFAKYADFSDSFTAWMNEKSFGLYVFHYLGIALVATFLGKNKLLLVPVVYLLSLMAGFGGGFILSSIVAKIPFLRWVLLGIKKK